MDKIIGFELLQKIIKDNLVHEDYDRVKSLADKYYKMKTGDGLEELLHKIETRVSDEEFKQIKAIYRSIIPSTLNSTKLPFLKAARKQPIVRMISFKSESDKKKTELETYINTYWGDKSIEEYLEYAFVDYNYIDPNAFLITEFDDFDPKIEKAKPYPFVADSKQAVMFHYKNEILEYLVVKLPIKFKDGDQEKDGVKYTMYLGMDTIVFSQVAGKQTFDGNEVLEINSIFYEILYFEPKNEKVPAIRFGYLRDEVTKGRTFVSVFHAVMGFLDKTLKIDSELDLSCALVAFPQRFAYVSPCKGGPEGCKAGYTLNGGLCPICQGSGLQPAHKGTQDFVTLALPRDPEQMIDLEKMLVYKGPPIDLLTFQKEYLEYLKKSVHAMMFNADLYTRSEVSTTATEKNLERDNMNDTFYPFGRHYSATWEFVVRDIATFTDLNRKENTLTLQHKFPNDFKFKSLMELMEELKTAKDAGASTSTIAAIEDDINEILYSDRPEALKEMRIKNQVNPFRGYSEANIRFIISQGNTTLADRTLWENMESIFQQLEMENPELYDLDIKLIDEKVDAKVQEYIKLIGEEKSKQSEEFVASGNEPV